LRSLLAARGRRHLRVREQWADADALKTHSAAPAVATLFGTVGELLDGAPDIKMLQPVVAGDPAKGQLRP
jgi:quinol monooxygenase YgiN